MQQNITTQTVLVNTKTLVPFFENVKAFLENAKMIVILIVQ